MCPSQGDSFDIDRESSDSPREQTPDSDSGYMASCVTVVSTTSSSSRTFQSRLHNTNQPSDHLGLNQNHNKDENKVVVNSQTNTAGSRPNFLAEMQSAQQRRRLSKDSNGDTAPRVAPSNTTNSTTITQCKDVPKNAVPVVPKSNGAAPANGRGNANSLAEQLKTRLEERRRTSDEKEVHDLAADVQKAVNVANENSKSFAVFLKYLSFLSISRF